MTTVVSKKKEDLAYLSQSFWYCLLQSESRDFTEKPNMKSYNETVIDLNFGWHKDLSTLKSDIHRDRRQIYLQLKGQNIMKEFFAPHEINS